MSAATPVGDALAGRFLIGAGGCGLAVGAAEVAAALHAAISLRHLELPVLMTGCDGRCYANVQVVWQDAGGNHRAWDGVLPADVENLLDEASLPAPVEREGSLTRYPGQHRSLMADVGNCSPADITEAFARGRYAGLRRARAMPPADILDELEAAGISGRGGAYFPLALKWRGCCNAADPVHYLVVNAEEGEPGVFKDRHLLEGDPHLLLEGVLIAAHALNVERVFIFLNGEARLASERLVAAFEEADERGLVSVDIEFRFGAGGYVLGEESALLQAIEGERPMPRVRPPFPVTHGLWGHPTVINNVESLANVAIVMSSGVESFRSSGTETWPGTKLVSVSGDVERPGLYEISIGLPLRSLVYDLAGGVANGRELQAVLTGGPSGLFVPPSLLDTALAPRINDVMLGSGNVIVLDETRLLPGIVRQLTQFNAEESCGKCTPCREGVRRMLEILEEPGGTAAMQSVDRAELLELCDIASAASICGLGQMAANPVRSSLTAFPDQMLLPPPTGER